MKLSSGLLSTIFLVMLTDPSGLILFNVAAHGPIETREELAFRADYITHAKRSLGSCASKLYARDRLEKRHHKRSELVQKYVERKKRFDGVDINLNPILRKRDLSDKVDLDDLFPDKPECILTPELTIGPYYAPHQLIRHDIREDIPGVELLIALEVIDVNTCEPVPKVMIDFWHCTNNGVYSAFETEGTAGETFTRGLQATDSDGTVTITSIFPGWYTGRTTHIHIAAHINGTISSNGDYYSGGTNPHIGQLFFEEELLEQIQKNSLYANNTNQRQLNANDDIYKQFVSATKSKEYTMSIKFVEENNINAGLVATMVIGIDASKNYTLNGPGSGAPPGGASGSGTTSSTAAGSSGTGSPSGAVSSFTNFLPMTSLGISSILSITIGAYLFNLY